MSAPNSTATTRAPRLTERLIREDIPEVLSVVDEQLRYLEERLNDTGIGMLSYPQRVVIQCRFERLTRAKTYLVGKIGAESQPRASAKT